MNRNPRETRSGYPTVGVAMRPNDTVKSSRAGIGFDASGQMYFTNAAGTKVAEVPSTSVTLPMVVKLAIPLQAALTGVLVGGSLANPFGYDVIITNAVLRVTTQSTGASTMDIGVAADAVTSNDLLMDGVAGTAAGTFDNVKSAGTNGRSGVVWGSTQFVNVAEATGDVAGLVGTLYVTCYRAI